MKVLFIKNLSLSDGIKDFNFKRMSIYQIPNFWAVSLIEQGYTVQLLGYSDLKVERERKAEEKLQ